MPTFAIPPIELTQARVDRLNAAFPGVTVAQIQAWLLQQLFAEVIKREKQKLEAAQKVTQIAEDAKLEADLKAEGW